MNKLLYGSLAFLLFASCVGKYSSKAQQAEIDTAVKTSTPLSSLDTLHIDLDKSKLYWKGTKMRGARKHEGEIQLLSAFLLHENGQLRGGAFSLDMRSIRVTDIPQEDSIPIRNITNHLKSEDFFEVETYPISTFEITQIKELPKDNLEVSGNLTIKGITNHIQFEASNQGRLFSSKFTFDRFQWNIAQEGLTEKTLVDRDIEVRIELRCKF